MASGLRIPIQVNESGGVARDARDNQLSKLLGQAFAEGDNDNAFQVGAIGLQNPPTFRINDAATLGLLKLTAEKVMKKFQDEERAKLIGIKIYTKNLQNPNDPSPVQLKDGEALLSIEYVNLETQQRSTFFRRF